MSVESDYILQAKGISKRFGGVQALTNAELTLRCGEVHAIIGENGAGKTTLMNIFGGIIKRNKGIIVFNGEKVDFNSPLEAFKKGISTIHQELTMMPHLSVMENIFMGRLRKFKISSKGIINRHKLINAAQKTLDLIELSIDPQTLVKNLSISEQQEIEIIKALSGDARLIIMDEPNSSLTDSETKRLFNVIGKLKKRGVSIIYVSHKIEEVLQIADRITVLRDGRFMGTLERSKATITRLFSMIAGREKKKTQPRKNQISDQILLSVSGLGGNGFNNISFDLFKGEVLGFYGLVGSGRSELGRALFGVNPVTEGTISLDDQPVFIDSPKKAIANGIAMVPEDRKEQALFMNLPIVLNTTISHLPQLSYLKFFIKSKHEKSIINDYVQLLNIKMNETSQPISALSGGNQQKVVLARYLMIQPRILILDEPTHGIDVGAKEEVHRLIEKSAAKGLGIIFISSEMPEIMSISDRIAVLHEGQLAGLFKRKEVTEEKLIAYATGYKLLTIE
jgi:ABC-type sugar transport system ATPase subunit